MLFQVRVTTVCAIPRERDYDFSDYDTVSCWYGVNASSLTAAHLMAARVSEESIDRSGTYVGGLVVSVYAGQRSVADFADYSDYFRAPIDETGIFYVTGITHATCNRDTYPGIEIALAKKRTNYERNGPPVGCFAHPAHPEKPSEAVRIACTSCGTWAEIPRWTLLFPGIEGIEWEFEEDIPEDFRVCLPTKRFFDAHWYCEGKQSKLVTLGEDDLGFEDLSQPNRFKDFGVL